MNKLYPLTHPQKAVWYTEKIHQDTSIGNVAGSLRIQGKVDFNVLEKAINMFIKNNDGMRLKMTEVDGEPKQYVSEYEHKKIDFIDFSQYENPLQELYNWEEGESKIPFELMDCELFYFVMLKVADNDGGFYIKTHHLISDAWNMGLIGNEVTRYYHALKEGNKIEENKPSYIDYIQAEEKYKQSDRFKKDREYWHNKFGVMPEMTTLKTRTSKEINTKSKRKTFVTPQKFTNKLREYCEQNNISPYSLFLSALAMYINRTSSKEDIVLGTPILNRANKKEKETAGMFISTVPVRINISDDMDFKTFSENVSKECLSILRHQKYPYDLLLKEVRKKHNIIDNLYDIVVSYQNTKFNNEQNSQRNKTRWHFNGHQTNSLTININDRDDEGHLIIDYDFHEDLYYEKEIEFIHEHVLSLLWHGLDNPTRKINKIEMLKESEKKKILYEFNDTAADYPKDKTIQQLFEEQVEKTPENTALVFEENQMTYKELNQKSNQLARVLRDKGVKPDQLVGIMVHRSFEMIIGILGVLKAGGAYVPLDPDYPEERIKYMLDDSNTNILLTQEELKDKVEFNGEIIDIKDKEIYKGDGSNLENVNKPSDLCYVIYTSGSTGNPKGVMIEHRNVNNFIKGVTDKIDFSSGKTIVSVTTISFDIFVLETLLPLTNGVKVVMANEDQQIIPEYFREVVLNNDVDMLQTTPSRIQLLLTDEKCIDCFERLTDVMVGGEPFLKTLLKRLKDITSAKIYNMYGPTETTVWSTIKDMTDSNVINIGKPIANTQIYILDKHLNKVPIGTQGELYIGGDGVARGYLNRTNLTNARFIPNPFMPGEKIYKTGDITRWFSGGEIECLGRVDNQVKIRGMRVELEEIENQLLKHEDIKEVVVIAKNDEYNKQYLCAYIICNKKVDSTDLRTFLSNQIPQYMIPSYFVKLDNIPLTPNGKINKKALPEPDLSNVDSKYVEPTNEIEEILTQVWSEVLGINKVGIDDDFFELGGDSLLIIQIQIRLLSYNWNISTQDMYKYTTIRALSERIMNLNKIKDNHKRNVCIDDSQNRFQNSQCSINISKQRKQYKNILLLGVTGFLGIHILDCLLSNTNSNIYCLIRGEDYNETKRRLEELLQFYFFDKYKDIIDNRVFIIKGDVTLYKFGIDANEYIKLGKDMDAIIHSAAIVKYYGDYSEFEKVNVFGTKNVIEFSLEFKIPFYYISTLGVSGNYLVSQTKENVNFTEDDLYIGQNYMENMYVRSKFEAESLVHNYIDSGLNATIFRVGNLTGRYSDGYFQKNINENSFYNILRSIIQLGVMSQDMLEHKLEFTPVDLCSEAIVELVKTNEAKGKVFHIFNHNTIKVSDILRLFSKLGINIKVLEKHDYKKVIIDILADKSKLNILDGIINDLDDEKQLTFKSDVTYSSTFTLQHLNQLGFEWPCVDLEYVKKIINHMKDREYLKMKQKAKNGRQINEV